MSAAPQVRAEDVSDLALLPRRFDLFEAHVKTTLELLAEKLISGITLIRMCEQCGAKATRVFALGPLRFYACTGCAKRWLVPTRKLPRKRERR